MSSRTLLIAILAVCPAAAADFYLSNQGDDGAAGTSPAAAWRTLERAGRHQYGPGDRLLLAAGQTFTGNLVIEGGTADPARPLHVTSTSGGPRARIEAGKGTAIQIRNRGAVHVSDLIVHGGGYAANRGYGIDAVNLLPGGKRLAGIRIERVEASGFWNAGIFAGGRPVDGGRSGFENVRILDSVAHHNVYYGIRVDGHYDIAARVHANADVVIERAVVHHNHGDPAYMENHSGSGIKVDDTAGGAIRYSVAYENGAACDARVGGPCGIWTHGSDRIVISHNISYRNRTGRAPDGCGFDFDAGVTNSILEYNLSFENDGAGYLLYTYKPAPHRWANNIVRYNVSQYDARKNRYAGIYIENAGTGIEGLEVHDNRILLHPSLTGGENSGIHLGKTSGVTLRNNTVISAGGAALVRVMEGAGGAVWRDNIFIAEDGKFHALVMGRALNSAEALRQALENR